MLSGKKKSWAFPIAASLLLHLSLLCLLSTQALQRPRDEPKLTVTLRAAPRAVAQQVLEPRASSAENAPKPRVRPRPDAPKKKSAPRQQPEAAWESPARSTPPADIDRENNDAPQTGTPDTAAQPRLAQEAGQALPAASGQPASPAGLAPVNAATLRIIKRVVPEYPSFSRKRREDGSVQVVVAIKKGVPVSAVIGVSSGHERLDASALRAARQWRFDQEEEIRAAIEFNFSLTD